MLKNKRLRLLRSIALQFILLSAIVRLVFCFWSLGETGFSLISFFKILLTGLFFDIGTISFFLVIYIIYLVILPNKWVGTLFDKIFGYFFYFFTTLIITFSFFAELTFWDEFRFRFNFIAVDYLIYTYEVVKNINESYPIPLLLAIIFSLVFIQYYILKRRKVFANTFSGKLSGNGKVMLILLLAIPALYGFFINNTDAEWSKSRYENEISKSGIYSFFAAFRNNELKYDHFYIANDIDKSFAEVKSNLYKAGDTLMSADKHSIARTIKSRGEPIKPNVIFVCLESFDADFLDHFGNKNNLTPTLDSLLGHSIYFENLYATGTRTVRGMEAITLSVPPSPGRSIVKRKNNTGLNNIGNIFKAEGYKRVFFYGGDGYFDNMNQFFGGNGFDIVDRGRGFLLGDNFKAKRTTITDNEVTFENAWGICDEDIYNKVISEADKDYAAGQPFFNFIMTTSNHKPFTYPENKIDIASGSGREGAVKYTDYAIKQLLDKARTKPWFANTVFVFMADHCASSAGKWELNVAKYHIPAIIYNLPDSLNKSIQTQCSQIDLFPTLFGYLNWTYESNFFGKDVNSFGENDSRAFIGNYRKLGLLKGDELTILGDQKKSLFFTWNKSTNELTPQNEDKNRLSEIVSYYQTISYMYENGLLKVKSK